MIDGLIAGRLYGEAQIRTGQNGKRYVTCKVRATAGDGETLFVNVIAFDDDLQTALLALSDADSVTLTGALTPKVWTDKNGLVKPALDMVAHGLLTAYHVRRKQQTVSGESASQDLRAQDHLQDPL
ncbi:MAG TPA: single-stranded DNA-binding protein [Trinickia sp.]|jgi:single-stranded DNA-binding protein|uniref:single-stranded DNA-binding protein n=1 Tax=Trinickia sp. TaxID=2571163 RepID=UPI002CD400BE|nr:single-stranded DNA-binding protein [Trinickia sp.]HTI16472.1 single-stranded DNA-binding protein [Trinickia sp.]